MTHACSAFAARTSAALTAARFSGPVQCNHHLVPEIYLSWDEAKGDIQVEATSDDSCALQFSARVGAPSGWFTLNLPLGGGHFETGDVLGVILDARAGQGIECSAFLRSRQDSEAHDTDMLDPLMIGPERGVHVLMHTVSPACGLPLADRFHTLILRLPQTDFDLTLYDFRVFVLPAARGLASRGPTLSSVAS